MILAGGLARRMGGVDKTLLLLDRRTTILEVLTGRLAPQCAPMILSANGDPARFAGKALPTLADAPGPSRGPLAGVLAGLAWASTLPSGAWLLTVPGDTPFVPPDLVARLRTAAVREGASIARAVCDGRRHNLVALWSFGLRAALADALLNRDQRKVTAFQAEAGVVDVEWSPGPWDPFFNINTADDLGVARTLFEGMSNP